MNHDVFLQSILDDPDDDAARLVFADWLDEHGEPQRAAFIRAQVRLASMSEDDPARPALLLDEAAYLSHAQEELFAKKRPAWLAKLPNWAAKGLAYERGFPARLRLTANRFTEQAAEIMAVVPLQHVELTAVKRAPGALAACEALRRLRSLTVRHDGVGTEGARMLAASPHVAGLTKLVLDHAQITAEATVALAGSPHLAGLRQLDLSGNSPYDRGAEALANSPHLTNLERLSLEFGHVGPRGVKALAGSPALGKLRELNLNGARLDSAAESLAGSEQLAALTSLHLAHCEVWGDNVLSLLEPGGLPKLRQLRFGCPLWAPSFWLVEPPRRLRGGLSLCLRQLTGDFAVLADSPLLAACRTLEVSFSDGSICQALAGSPAAAGLVKLSLEHCRLQTADVKALAQSHDFGALRELSLAHNPLTKAALAHLLTAPFVRQLTVLDLSYTDLDKEGALLLARTDALDGLRELRLGGNSPTVPPAAREELTQRYGARVVAVW